MPTQPAKPLRLIKRLVAKQIVDCLQHWPGMRLYRNLVLRAQRMEIQRRHNRGYRRATGLMSANL